MSHPRRHVPQDWAPYPRLEDAVRAYIRDADAALEALGGVLDTSSDLAFTCERVASTQDWGDSLWQEVAVTDGRRLVLWHGDDEADDAGSGSLMFSSSVRTIPLSAIVDQGLRNRFRTEPDGSRTMHAVMLYLSTQTPERSMTELTEANETRTVQYVETYRFSKSVTDGGLAQMQRLLQFGRALSKSDRTFPVSGTRPATGHQHELRRGAMTARVGEVAAVLREFSVDGTHFTEVWDDDWVPPMGCGIVLVPWPNRIKDATWIYQDKPQKLDITDLSLGHATHGLLRNTAYQVISQAEASVTLAASVYPQHGYPFTLDTSVTYALHDDGLRITHYLQNVGEAAAPFGVGAHPYLRVGEHPVADLTITLSGTDYARVDERLIPVAVEPVEGTANDLRTGVRLSDLDADVALTGFAVSDGRVEHRLAAPDGTGLVLWADEDLRLGPGLLAVDLPRPRETEPAQGGGHRADDLRGQRLQHRDRSALAGSGRELDRLLGSASGGLLTRSALSRGGIPSAATSLRVRWRGRRSASGSRRVPRPVPMVGAPPCRRSRATPARKCGRNRLGDRTSRLVTAG